MENIQPDLYQKISAIQLALLQYNHQGKKVSVQVRIVADDNDSLHCVVSDETAARKMLHKNVTLIQKDKENYMYVAGHIAQEVQSNKRILSINIKKACWFIRKSKGSVSWLQEKCVHLPQMKVAS